MSRHAARVSSSLGYQLEHGREEVGDALGLLGLEVVFLPQNVGQRPVPQAVDVTQLAFSVKDLLRPLAGQAEGLGEGAQQLDYLRDVIVVFSVLGARLRVKEVVASDELEHL